ncbi:unnamed protein product [Hydatigera taeniaeformis]|uniref:ANK_REP_REGION domain-containing protein n=1 Tax=Hydatigena taeniaeformis TaxID=6205 RepID=A0A0R3WIY5_HYDTA|nr:unnamed protein product [Hydatigera taeniaeformis]
MGRLLSQTTKETALLFLSRNCKNIIATFLQSNPLTLKELEILAPNFDRNYELGTNIGIISSQLASAFARISISFFILRGSREERQRCMTGRLMGAVPQVPCGPFTSLQERPNGSLCSKKEAGYIMLPIRKEQSQLVKLVNENRVVVVASHQGCGKSTQIPQVGCKLVSTSTVWSIRILLEDCHAHSQRCRIICTQPCRLSAHANADRVAHERSEIVGQSVGYQIRLESKVSPKTVLTFCTHGVLLRTIFADPTFLNATTHILVDEIDEEDLFSRKLTAEGREVRLPITRDTSKHTCNLLLGTLHRILAQYPHLRLILIVNLKSTSCISSNGHYLQLSLNAESISVEWIPVDYKHSETGITPLMLFSAAGLLEVVERLLHLGADVFERVPLPRAALPPDLVTLGTDRAAPTHHSLHHLSMIGANAFDLARLYGHALVADLLKAHMQVAARSLDHPLDDWEGNLLRFGCWFANPMVRMPNLLQPARSSALERNYSNWVEQHFSGLMKHRFYQVARNWVGSGSTVDFELLVQLISKVDSALAPADLKQIFMQPPTGVRKIILATEIAESSVAISDIAYVIDTGLVRKEVCLHAKLLSPPGENLNSCFQSLPCALDPLALNQSIRSLRVIDAMDSSGDLTELGSHMCDLPLPPRYSKMVLVSIALKCVDPILTIACILASENPCQLRASGFVKARGSGDIRDLNTHSENWAVVKAALVAGMYDNLAQVDSKSGNLIVSASSRNASEVRASKTPYWVHPSPLSVLATNLTDSSPVDLKQLPSHWLVYDKLIGQCPVALDSRQSNYEFLSNRSRLQKDQPLTMADIERILKNFNTEVPRLEALGLRQSEGSIMKIQEAMLVEHQSVKERTPPKHTVVLRLDGPNGILAYECELEVARLISDLRQKWNSLLLRRLRNPGKPSQQQDEALLSTIVAVLSAEEQVLGLRQPTGVGARPRPMATELCNQNDTVTTASNVTGSLSSPTPVGEGIGDGHKGEAPTERPITPAAVPHLPQTCKQPTGISLSTFALFQEGSNWDNTFSGGEWNDSNKRKHPHDASCVVLQQERLQMRGDGLTDSFAQLKLADSQSSVPDFSVTYCKFEEAQTHQRICQQQNQWSQRCCGMSRSPQVMGDDNGAYPSGINARPLMNASTYADRGSTDNFRLLNPNIQCGSLQPLG